jgi:hypothetical protein
MTPDEISAVWFKLPIKLRQRYWRETEYGRLPPSLELCAAILAATAPKPQDSGVSATEDGGKS